MVVRALAPSLAASAVPDSRFFTLRRKESEIGRSLPGLLRNVRVAIDRSAVRCPPRAIADRRYEEKSFIEFIPLLHLASAIRASNL